MEKPTIEQVAWVAECICQNADRDGTYRNLIYDIMGYNGEAYQPLYEAGLLRINNAMNTDEDNFEIEDRSYLLVIDDGMDD